MFYRAKHRPKLMRSDEKASDEGLSPMKHSYCMYIFSISCEVTGVCMGRCFCGYLMELKIKMCISYNINMTLMILLILSTCLRVPTDVDADTDDYAYLPYKDEKLSIYLSAVFDMLITQSCLL